MTEQSTPEPEEECWLFDLWTTEPVPSPELSPPQSVSVNYLDVPTRYPSHPIVHILSLAPCTCLDSATSLVPLSSSALLSPLVSSSSASASSPPAQPCEVDSLQAHDATLACQLVGSTLALLSLGSTVIPWAPPWSFVILDLP
ncbi:hypothetical protein PO909_030554 [Leuciscus waleckii]